MKLRLENLYTWLVRHWKICSALVITGVLCFLAGNWQLIGALQKTSKVLEQQQLQIEQLDRLRSQSQRDRDFLATELAVEKNTNQLLQQDVKELQQQVFELKKELAVYQKIVAPGPESGTLVIDSFRLSSGAEAGRFQFSLLLIEQNKQKKKTLAQLEIKLKGKRKKRAVELDLLKLAGFAPKAKRLQIQNFRSVDGEFVLPAGFTAEKLEIRLSSQSGQGGAAVTLKRELPWNGQSEILD